ncbi:hypothetical protein DNTS_033525 [Danionella cerebrum]|uniref:Uncharacterized protein n=1 Tax=Danionella cerebrum TaxID=2873325 RepID=A0A553NHW0_9TELE|nr:hypothetical protein DNTS_033525 [Danionella translucida]
MHSLERRLRHGALGRWKRISEHGENRSDPGPAGSRANNRALGLGLSSCGSERITRAQCEAPMSSFRPGGCLRNTFRRNRWSVASLEKINASQVQLEPQTGFEEESRELDSLTQQRYLHRERGVSIRHRDRRGGGGGAEEAIPGHDKLKKRIETHPSPVCFWDEPEKRNTPI